MCTGRAIGAAAVCQSAKTSSAVKPSGAIASRPDGTPRAAGSGFGGASGGQLLGDPIGVIGGDGAMARSADGADDGSDGSDGFGRLSQVNRSDRSGGFGCFRWSRALAVSADRLAVRSVVDPG